MYDFETSYHFETFFRGSGFIENEVPTIALIILADMLPNILLSVTSTYLRRPKVKPDFTVDFYSIFFWHPYDCSIFICILTIERIQICFSMVPPSIHISVSWSYPVPSDGTLQCFSFLNTVHPWLQQLWRAQGRIWQVVGGSGHSLLTTEWLRPVLDAFSDG